MPNQVRNQRINSVNLSSGPTILANCLGNVTMFYLTFSSLPSPCFNVGFQYFIVCGGFNIEAGDDGNGKQSWQISNLEKLD